jgi:hypothetical protein
VFLSARATARQFLNVAFAGQEIIRSSASYSGTTKIASQIKLEQIFCFKTPEPIGEANCNCRTEVHRSSASYSGPSKTDSRNMPPSSLERLLCF